MNRGHSEIEANIDLRRVGTLGMLVELGPARASRRRDHGRVLQHAFFDAATDGIRLVEIGARDGDGRNRERPFLELGQEPATHDGEGSHGDEHAQKRRGREGHRPTETPAHRGLVGALECSHEPALPVRLDDLRPGQEDRAQHRCHGHRDDERGQDPHDVGQSQRAQHPALDPGEEEERQEDDRDDQRRVDDRAPHLARRIVDDLQRGPVLPFRQMSVQP